VQKLRPDRDQRYRSMVNLLSVKMNQATTIEAFFGVNPLTQCDAKANRFDALLIFPLR
jgi:hypothetical protein